MRRERMNRVNMLLGLAPAVSAPMPMAYVAPVMVTPVDTSAVDAKQFEVRRGAIKPKKEPEVYQPMNAMSQPMNATPQPMNAMSQQMNAMSQPMNAMSQPLDAMSQQMNAMSQPMNAMSQPLDAMSQPLDAMSQQMNAMSQPMNAMSQPLDTTPQPMNAMSQPLNTTPQPLNTKSQPVNTTPQTAPQNDPQEVLNTLEDVMAELGTVEPEDIEGMEPEEQKQYLMEFITPITAAVEQDDFHVICDELMKEDPSFLVKAVNSPQDMYEAIQKAKTVLKK